MKLYIWGGRPNKKVLKRFNNSKLTPINKSVIVDEAYSTIKVLFLGNSIALHPLVEDFLPCKDVRGMMATTPDSDYVHRLSKMIVYNHHVNVKFSVVNIADFERNFNNKIPTLTLVEGAEIKKPDILIVQIGENVSEDEIKDPHNFEEKYIQLLSLFPNNKRIITLPFWPSKQKQYAITNVAIRSNSYLVDISHLGDGTDKQNFASLQKKHYRLHGVASHPGDIGMQHIADCYYATINAILY
ncbi:SGNH/GDSL hydrolase family protein [Prevotellaceae bacterium LKV-178-WT-2A]|uniref:SGNH/GDSL hydrolase family protein n=2 Tax=Hallella mizrahii TaxID=2606637 RepID=A0A7K0KIL0_9BACT|nr:SGNH/GDSL hydrolase family protein [Hallella mizrahii]